jgi:hypothetical protein
MGQRSGMSREPGVSRNTCTSCPWATGELATTGLKRARLLLAAAGAIGGFVSPAAAPEAGIVQTRVCFRPSSCGSQGRSPAGSTLASVGVPAPVQDHRVPRQSRYWVGQHSVGSRPVRVAYRAPAVRIRL